MNIKKSIEPFSQATIYYFKANELDMHLDFFKGVFKDMQPRVAQIGSRGSIVVPDNKIKIVFENMLPKQVETFLFDKQVLSIAPVQKSHELILMFEEGHAHAVLQWYGDSKSNPDFYYKFDFVSASHADGGIKGYLSVFIPDECKITWADKLEKSKGTFLASGKIPMEASLVTKLYHSQYSELQRNFDSKSLYLIFQVTDLEFGIIEQKMFDTEASCIVGELSYSAHSLLPNSYNCFSSLNLLTEKLGIDDNVHNYFFDEQLDTQDMARKFALISSRPTNIHKYTDLFASILDRLMEKEDNDVSQFGTMYMENYFLVNCDTIRGYKINTNVCNYNNICAIEENFDYGPLTYSEEKNLFSHTSLIIINNDGSVRELNSTRIFTVDAEHQIKD